MKLMTMLQAFEFDELMPMINEMFPGTAKYREQLQNAYNMMMAMTPVPSGASIQFKIIKVPKSDYSYMGAEDKCFQGSWEETLGKTVHRAKGVDLDNGEIVANCFVNMCLQGRYPHGFEKDHNVLVKDA